MPRRPSDEIPFASLAQPQTPRKSVIWNGCCALVLGVLANLLPIYFILAMLKIPAGASIRPMIEASSIFFGALIGFVAFALAIRCAARSRRWWVGWVFAIVDGLLGLAKRRLPCMRRRPPRYAGALSGMRDVG